MIARVALMQSLTQETIMNGSLLRILIANNAGDTLYEVSRVRAILGLGLEGDRYAKQAGTFSYKPKVRDVTLISEEAFLIAKRDHGVEFTHEQARRNLIVSLSVKELNAFVGLHFRVGQVTMFGTELCDPCKLPAKQIGKHERDFINGFNNAGGIRARIESDGVIDLNSHISHVISLAMLPPCP